MKEIQARKSIHGAVGIPGSKSISHRALIAAGLAEGTSRIENVLICDDTLFTMKGLQRLGVGITREGGEFEVQGTGGRFPLSAGIRSVFLGDSGTSYRLLLSAAALARGGFVLTGSRRMRERPVGALVRALKSLGVEAAWVGRDGYPPVRIRAAGIRGGKVAIKGKESSQYVSSLLLAAPYASGGLEIVVEEDLVSRPYVDLTLDVMEGFGVPVSREGYGYFRVPAGKGYTSRRFHVEGDVSSASYFWAAAAVTGGSMTTSNVRPFATRQGDMGLLGILERMGCMVERKEDRVTVRGNALSGVSVDMGAMPDMVPTLASVALFARGKTVIRNVPHLRHKESDRLGSIALEWGRLGGRVEELEDGLVIHGRAPLRGTVVDPHNDHRMAMSLAVIGLKVPGTRIDGESCVNKSFPCFWALWDRMD